MVNGSRACVTHSLTSGSGASVRCPLVCHFRVSLRQRNPRQCWVCGVLGQRVRLATYRCRDEKHPPPPRPLLARAGVRARRACRARRRLCPGAPDARWPLRAAERPAELERNALGAAAEPAAHAAQRAPEGETGAAVAGRSARSAALTPLLSALSRALECIPRRVDSRSRRRCLESRAQTRRGHHAITFRRFRFVSLRALVRCRPAPVAHRRPVAAARAGDGASPPAQRCCSRSSATSAGAAAGGAELRAGSSPSAWPRPGRHDSPTSRRHRFSARSARHARRRGGFASSGARSVHSGPRPR